MLNTTIPTIEIKTSGVDLSTVETVNVTIKQGSFIIVKSNDDIEVDNDVMSISLTQEEAASFKDGSGANSISIAATKRNGESCNIKVIWAKRGSRTSYSAGSSGGGTGEPTTVTVSVAGTVTGEAGTNAKVENIGDSVNVRLKFTIPRGQQGKQGDKGESGDNGEDGIDGKSAYDLAVQEGFTGSLLEWLASLKGEKGDTGDFGNHEILDTEQKIRENTEQGKLIDALVLKDIYEQGIGGGNITVLDYSSSLEYLNGDSQEDPSGGEIVATTVLSYDDTLTFLNEE